MWLLQTMYEDPIDWGGPEAEVVFWPEFWGHLVNASGHWMTWWGEGGRHEEYCDRNLASGAHLQ